MLFFDRIVSLSIRLFQAQKLDSFDNASLLFLLSNTFFSTLKKNIEQVDNEAPCNSGKQVLGQNFPK